MSWPLQFNFAAGVQLSTSLAEPVRGKLRSIQGARPITTLPGEAHNFVVAAMLSNIFSSLAVTVVGRRTVGKRILVCRQIICDFRGDGYLEGKLLTCHGHSQTNCRQNVTNISKGKEKLFVCL